MERDVNPSSHCLQDPNDCRVFFLEDVASGRVGGTSLTFNGEVLDGTAFPTAAVWRQAEASDAPASPDPGAQHVVWVQVVAALRFEKQLRDYFGC